MMTPDDSVDAAELALGLLDGEPRATAIRRCLSDPAFAHDVERWRSQFATLFTEVPEVVPGDSVSARILGETAPVANDNRWKYATLAASLVAAMLLVVVMTRAPAPAPARVIVASAPAPLPLVAAMAPSGADAKAAPFSAAYQPDTGMVRITLQVDVPAGRDAQLWWIGADGTPHSVGLIQHGAANAVAIAVTERARIAPGTTLAVSLEPLGGSPKPTPTGPVVAAGALTQL